MSLRDAIFPFVAVLAVSGCAEPAPDDPGECTPATDVVPLDEIAARMRYSSTMDMAVARDGTLYFVSSIQPNLSSIGRRVTCGEIEPSWRTVPAYAHELEISSDNQLYIAARSQSSSTKSARLYRAALDVDGVAPTLLVDTAGEAIWSLSAGTGGRVFYVQGGQTRAIYTTSSTQQPEAIWNLLYDTAEVAASPFGTVEVLRQHNDEISTATISSQPGEPVVFRPVDDPWWLYNLRTDELGGLYGLRLGPEGVYQLVHAESADGVRVVVGDIAGGSAYDARVAYALDGSATSAAILLETGEETAPELVELPVPVMMP